VEKEIFNLDAWKGPGKLLKAKAETSGLCQSVTAEGVCVSVAEGKKNI